jgi:hypothetical protein
MTQISNYPSWWPLIDSYRFYSYFVVAACTAMMYDWALTLGKEIELIWRHRWSFMTVLYFLVRYTGIPFSVMDMLISVPSISVTSAGCTIMNATTNWMNGIMNALLGVIMIARLYAMYHGSRKMLIFLVAIYLVVNITCIVMLAMGFEHIVGKELLLHGFYECSYSYEKGVQQLIIMVWILNTVWEVLALCLAIWIAVKRFREQRGLSTGWVVGDCFTVLIKTHVLYFAIFVATSCLHIGFLSPKISRSWSLGAETYYGTLQICSVLQKFVLGPRLILGVREYNAKSEANCDAGMEMTDIVFQERVDVSTSGGE